MFNIQTSVTFYHKAMLITLEFKLQECWNILLYRLSRIRYNVRHYENKCQCYCKLGRIKSFNLETVLRNSSARHWKRILTKTRTNRHNPSIIKNISNCCLGFVNS